MRHLKSFDAIFEKLSNEEILRRIISKGYKSKLDFTRGDANLLNLAIKNNLLNAENIPGWIEDDKEAQLRKDSGKRKEEMIGRKREKTKREIINKIESGGYENVTHLRKENPTLFMAGFRYKCFDDIIWSNPLPKHLSDDELIALITSKGFTKRSDFLSKKEDSTLYAQASKRGLLNSENIPGYQERPIYTTLTDDEIKEIIKGKGYKYKIELKKELRGIYDEASRRGIDRFANWEYPHEGDRSVFAFEFYRKNLSPWKVYVGVATNIEGSITNHLNDYSVGSVVSRFIKSEGIDRSQIKVVLYTKHPIPIQQAIELEKKVYERYDKDYRWEIINTRKPGRKTYGYSKDSNPSFFPKRSVEWDDIEVVQSEL